MRRSVRLLVAMLALLLAGCGTGAAEEDSIDVVGEFQSAIAANDGAAACDQLTAALRSTLEQDEEEACDKAVLAQDLSGGGRPTRSRVYITSALVTVTGGGDAFLDETPSGWRIAAAGCTRSGDTFECRLED